MSDHNDIIDYVLSCRTPLELFGGNIKRAKITYRRILRSVHPDLNADDVDRANDATTKVISFWRSYMETSSASSSAVEQDERNSDDNDNKRGRRERRTITEMSRNATCTLFNDDGKRLIVRRRAGITETYDTSNMSRLIKGIPIAFPKIDDELTIRQPDGNHNACHISFIGEFSNDEKATIIPVKERCFFLDDLLQNHLWNDVLDPADATWLAKRTVMIACALFDANMVIRDCETSPLVFVDSHVMCFADPWNIAQCDNGIDDDNVTREWVSCNMQMIASKIERSTRTGSKTFNMVSGCRFFDDPHRLILDLCDISNEIFEKRRFHEMKIR